MSDVESLLNPSREGRTQQQDQTDLQACCGLPSSPSTCVNSAFYHIQEMRRLAGNRCQLHQFGKYHSAVDQDKHYSKKFRFQSRDSDSDSGMSTDLYVEGIAISVRDRCQRSPLQKKVNDVLSEVMHLIERLEADRQHAEEALQNEKSKRHTLENKVDSISLWRQTEHPALVQKEHEACRRDITELRWQLKREKKKSDQLQEKVSHAELLNQHLQEDISFTREQLPLMRENLDIQRGLINQIQAAKAEADEVCSKTKSELFLAQEKLKEMELDAKKTNILLDHELVEMRNHLAEKLEDLNLLKRLEIELLADINGAEETIASTEKKCANTTWQIQEIAKLEKTEEEKISQLTLKIEDEMQKNEKLKEKLISIEKNKLTWEEDVSCIEAQLQTKRAAFAAVCESNLKWKQKVEDCEKKICESEKAAKQMRVEQKQMLQKITDNDEQWEKARKEVTQAVSQHSVTKAKLEEQEQLTFMEEQRARTETETLKKELTGQLTAMEVIKAQCATVEEALKKQQESSELINKQLQKDFEESYSLTQALEAKVKKMKELTENLEKMESEHKVTLFNLEKEKKLKTDQLKAAQDLDSSIVKRYGRSLCRITDLKKKLGASDQMEKTVENIQEIISKLQKDLNVLESKNKSAAQIMSTFQSDINNCQQQTQRFIQSHTAHLQARKKEMEDTKEELKNAFTKNKQLASDYEGLRKTLLEAREDAVSALTKKNCTDETYHYYTKLSLFQKRMHKALVKYLEQRNLYSLAELDRCQALAQETAQKIKTAQDELSEEVQLLSVFLESLGDGSTTTDDTGEKTQACPDVTGLKG
ncbi:coiled-coil domain-containing protein 178 [Austrofundulus limnaeus]|uniref:Coiled-coil domain-containing protein 178 n=1 Tax=Austrofundulus limnaeus TaxID=52670 RepID=A0A2I4D031_AUSLI|nr:PREDICTED: coiled-coil domain-containing protein 178 [Austrofundulus limnaeus]